MSEGKRIAYCRPCDLAFCEQHRDEHFRTCLETPTAEQARIAGAAFCSVCSGILLPRSRERERV